MARTFKTTDVITLPRLDAGGALALAHELLTVADSVRKLPPSIGKARKKLTSTHAALKGALSDRFGQPAIASEVRKADLAEDAAWSAAHDWLLGWSKLAHPQSEPARELYERLFPDGLKFTLLPFKLEWTEVETRLARITEEKLDKTFDSLGGAPFLKTLRETHKKYGEALGVTSAKEAPRQILSIREPLLLVTDALRLYTLQVLAYVDEDDAASGELANTLLAPLYGWQSRGEDTESEPDPPESDAPTVPIADL